jgi:hypothetical protein
MKWVECGKNGKENKFIQKFSQENIKGRNGLEDLNINDR